MINPLFKVAQKIYDTWTFLAAPKFSLPPILPFYATADIPDAAQHKGAIIFVTDAASGADFQGSDGKVWLNLG